MRSYLFLMETGGIFHASISSSRETGCGRTRLVIEHYYGAHCPSSPALMGSVSSPHFWCTRSPTTLKIYYNIPSDWVVHNLLSVYTDSYGWHKSMAHFLYIFLFYPKYASAILWLPWQSFWWYDIEHPLESPHLVFYPEGRWKCAWPALCSLMDLSKCVCCSWVVLNSTCSEYYD